MMHAEECCAHALKSHHELCSEFEQVLEIFRLCFNIDERESLQAS